MPPARRCRPLAVLSAWIALVALVAAGCYPDNAPWMSLDGKYVARVPTGGENGAGTVKAVDLLTLSTGKWQRILLPENGSAEHVFWLDGRLLVYATHRPADAPADAATPAINPPPGDPPPPVKRWWSVDPGQAAVTATNLPGTPARPYRSRHDGQLCLELIDTENRSRRLYSIGEWKELAKTELQFAPIADGWSLAWPDPNRSAAEVAPALKLHKPDGTLACTVDASGLLVAAAGQKPELASVRLDAEHRRLLLVYGDLKKGSVWSFGVFDTATGKLQWQRTAVPSKACWGEAAVVGENLYSIEEPVAPNDDQEATFGAALVRYDRDGRTVIGTLETQPGDQHATFTVTPDHKQFAVFITGEHPRLVLVPIGDKLGAEAIKAFPLK